MREVGVVVHVIAIMHMIIMHIIMHNDYCVICMHDMIHHYEYHNCYRAYYCCYASYYAYDYHAYYCYCAYHYDNCYHAYYCCYAYYYAYDYHAYYCYCATRCLVSITNMRLASLAKRRVEISTTMHLLIIT